MTTFLLGSGVSIPAGLPSVGAITDQILSGDGLMRHTDGYYYYGQPEDANPSDARLKQDVLSLMNGILDNSKSFAKKTLRRAMSYEDIFFILNSAWRALSGNEENFFVDRALGRGCVSRNEELVDEAMSYTRDAVGLMLSRKTPTLAYLDSLLRASLDKRSACIFTLNHDVLLDRYLAERSPGYVDGFSAPVSGVRYWARKAYENSEGGVSFYKLHGSVDWYRLRSDGGDWYEEEVGIIVSGDRWHVTMPGGRRGMASGQRPEFLCGSFNKIGEYSRGIFLELHCHFLRRLRESRRLVVCGYGFGDQGINGRIVDWVYESKANRMVVIHPNPSELFDRARGAIRNKVQEWRRHGVLHEIAAGIESLDPRELSGALEG